jgi:hypothetical protein
LTKGFHQKVTAYQIIQVVEHHSYFISWIFCWLIDIQTNIDSWEESVQL